METTVDKFGRVVIPKKFRDSLGLAPGKDVVIAMEGDHIVMSPKVTDDQWVMEGDVLIFTGDLGHDLLEPVKADRTRRINDLISRSMG